MGNNMGGGSSKAAKVMKINGEFFKWKIPANVLDVIKDYPNHVLLDSEEFLRFNLRAKPLDPEDELKPGRIYLLVELPKFPGPIRRVRSSLNTTTVAPRIDLMKLSQRSASDLSIITRSTASTDSDDGVSVDSPAGSTRVKMRLPKVQVERIMKESGDEVEVAQKILQLYLGDSPTRIGGDVSVPVAEAGGGRGEERERAAEAKPDKHCLSGRPTCLPYGSYRRKYKNLTS
uniref:Uncharacterized protein n=1 Tax=Opuntia streptacantha TaxID=393608 RepID=A0A7C9DPG6_OPUST